MTPDALRLSLVVPTFNRKESLHRLLSALTHQTLSSTMFEVIVSIDGSEDGSRGLVESFMAPYRLRTLWQPNRGRASACNAGIRAAEGELLVLLDDDMEPERDLLSAHLRSHTNAEALGVCGAVPIRADPASAPVVRFVASKFNAHLDHLEQGAEIRFRTFYSGNFSIRRTLMTAHGMFDESFTVYGNEDTELSLRLLQAGVRLTYQPAAIAFQHYDKDFVGLAHDNYAKGQTAVIATRMHPEEFGEFTIQGFRAWSGKWHDHSWAWHFARAVLLRLTRIAPSTPRRVIEAVVRIEGREPPGLEALYRFVVDYFFWLGAAAAMEGKPPHSTPASARVSS